MMAEALITHGAIAGAVGVMVAQLSSASAQVAGMEAMSALVAHYSVRLEAFALAGGMARIEEAMSTHPDVATLQTKGIRTLASGAKWPMEIVTQSNYKWRHCLALTKAAMSRHVDNEELQVAGFEALRTYLDRADRAACTEDIKADGGVDLIEAVMTKHESNKRVQDAGASILKCLA